MGKSEALGTHLCFCFFRMKKKQVKSDMEVRLGNQNEGDCLNEALGRDDPQVVIEGTLRGRKYRKSSLLPTLSF